MQWHDRGLGQRADEDEHDRHTGQPAGGRVGDDVGEVVASRRLAQHDDADKHRQPAGGGDQKCLCCRAARGGALGVMADEEERQDCGDLPEDVQHQHVVAGDQAEHGAGERHHLGGEQSESGFVVLEVARAVEEDQGADAEDQQGHDGGEGVEPHVDVHRQTRDPLDAQRLLGVPVLDHPAQAHERDQSQREEGVAAPPADQHRRAQSCHRVRDQDGEQGRYSVVSVIVSCMRHGGRRGGVEWV